MKNVKKMKFTRNALMGAVLAASVVTAGFGFATLNGVDAYASAETAHTEAIFMKEGASVRYSAPTGIRFTAYVQDQYFTDGVLNEGFVVGMKVSVETSDTVADFNSTAEGWKWAESDVEGYQKFHVVIGGEDGADFPETEYKNDLTAYAYLTEDGEVVEETASVSRSIAYVANAALAKNELLKAIGDEKVLSDKKVSALDDYTETTTKLGSSSANLIGKTGYSFEWEEVSQAKGYFVAYGGKVINVVGSTRPMVNFTEFGEVERPTSVAIIAYGNGETSTYGGVAFNDRVAAETTLIDFNTAEDAARLVAGHPDTTHSEIVTSWHTAQAEPKFDSTKGNGGAAFIRVLPSTIAGGANNFIFALNLPQGLDLTNNDGIKVTLAVQWISSQRNTDTYFTLGNVGHPGASYKTKSTDSTKIVRNPADESINFTTIQFSAAEMKELGYTDGRTTLTFVLWPSTTVASGGSLGFWFDNISYYGMKETATGATLEDFNEAYDANNPNVVAGFSGYTDDSNIPTAWHTSQPTPGFNADLGNGGAAYIRVLPTNNQKLIFTVNFGSALNLDNNAGVKVTLAIQWISGSYNTSARLAVGNVSNPASSLTTAPTDSTKIVRVPNSEQVGENMNFVTVYFTAAELKALGYTNESTSLTFILWNETATLYSGASAGIWLDDISYFNFKEGMS